ncbi:MFS transporter [Pseudonocardia sp. NPDC049154]|uniref:MFS transporter n=1 Tax=Pseudonocardia sp. NPDC049154 TaxID=3155501 RepID=UPI0033F4C48A
MSEDGSTPGAPAPDGARRGEDIAGRLARLPTRGMSRRLVVAMAIAFFFDLGDQGALGIAAPAMRAQLGFELSDIALLVSSTFVGLLIGALTGGRLADRIGRLPVMWASLAVASVGSGLHVLMNDLVAFAVLRVVSAIGMGALFVVAVTYLVEMSPTHRRTTRTAIAYFVGMMGTAVIATTARFVIPLGPDGWRVVFAIGALGLLLLPLLKRLPESPLWLASRGRLDDAYAALQKFEAGTAPVETLPPPQPLAVPAPARQAAQSTGAWRDLFRGSLLSPMLLLIVVWIVFSMLTQTFNSWLPTILQLRGFSGETLLTITAVALYGAPLGSLAAFLLGTRFRRRAMLAGVTAAAALSGILFGLVPAAGLVATATFAQFFLIAWFAPMLNATMAESFPSRLRSSGSGTAFGAGRLANIVAPFTVAAALTALGPGFIGWFMVVGWIVVGVACVALQRLQERRLSVPVAATTGAAGE